LSTGGTGADAQALLRHSNLFDPDVDPDGAVPSRMTTLASL
jgi:hypothetical protein